MFFDNLRLRVLIVMAFFIRLLIAAGLIAFGLFSINQGNGLSSLAHRPGLHRVIISVLYSDDDCAKSCTYRVHGEFTPPGSKDWQSVVVYPDFDNEPDSGTEITVLVPKKLPGPGDDVKAVRPGEQGTSDHVWGVIALCGGGLLILWPVGSWAVKRIRRYGRNVPKVLGNS